MSRNPYAPPESPVADPELAAPTPIEKPSTVVHAIRLTWISLATSVVSMVLGWKPFIASLEIPEDMGTTLHTIIIVVLVASVLVTLWMIWKLNEGRNWMRILFLVGTVFSLLNQPFTDMGQQGWIFDGGSLIAFVLQTCATVLLFLPASAPWFRKRKAA